MTFIDIALLACLLFIVGMLLFLGWTYIEDEFLESGDI